MYTKALAALAAFLVTSSATPIPRQAAPNKRGICYNDPASLAKFGGAISWALDWASTPLGDLGNVQFVPVLKPGQEGTWDTDIGNAAYLLGPNEPDQPIEVGGTATSASVVAAYYFEGGAMAKHQGQAKIGGPAISSGGIQWLRDFSAACAGNCKIVRQRPLPVTPLWFPRANMVLGRTSSRCISTTTTPTHPTRSPV
jgi:hypothetical protein